jgi:phosphoribosylformylglycinamidine synthase
MSAKGESGIKINLKKVPLREKGMNSYEIMLSESQERMLVVIKKGNGSKLKKIFNKWDLNCKKIGEVTDTGCLEVYNGKELVSNIPVQSLVLGGGAPQYDMPSTRSSYLDDINSFTIDSIPKTKRKFNTDLLKLLAAPNITSKKYVYQQYDSTVRTNTVIGPGSDSAVVRLKDTNKALAISTDCNGRYVYLDPFNGAKMAVAESARNVVCSGAQPLAITNCLNFGNPKDPEIYWQFKEAVLGMGDMCRELNTPVTGGNVSFYNETLDNAVYPTPVIGMVGLLENVKHVTTMEYKNSGDFIVAIGTLNGVIGGSEYLKTIHKRTEGPIANIDMRLEHRVQAMSLEAIEKGIINSAHDLSDGGLAVNIAESVICAKGDLGASLDLVRKLEDVELLFGECPSVIIVTVSESDLYELVVLAKKHDIHSQTIGKVTDNGKLRINDKISLKKEKLSEAYFNSLEQLVE